MEGFIDRLAELIRALFGADESPAPPRGPANPRSADRDYQEAWQELDEFMRTGTNTERHDERGDSRTGERSKSRRTRAPVDEDLRKDYSNLEIPFGSDIEEVKKAYKTLILRYHPDKHAGDPERLRVATEITKKINESFERIRTRLESDRNDRR